MDDLRQLREENKRLKQENQELRERVAAAEARIKQLVELVAQNSRNSNWPSSRDKSRQKPKPKSLRPKTERQAGGQEGDEGHTLEFKPEPEVKEIQAETVLCPCCGKSTTADFPADVTHPVQYGCQVKRLALYLRSEQFIPYERSRQMLADLFELPISTGSLENFVATAAEQVKPVTEAIRAALTTVAVAHADETGFYINGQRHWLHTVSTPELTTFAPHQRRGQAATNDIGILPQLTGTLVHDAWPSYFKYQLLVHALYNVHHLRDLTAVGENDQHS